MCKKKPIYTKVNQLRYDSFSQKNQSTPGQVFRDLNDIDLSLSLFPPCRALVFLLLTEHHLKRMLNNHQTFIFVSECARPCMAKLER